MPRFVRYHAVIPLGSVTLKNTPPIPATCSIGNSFLLEVVSPEAPASVFVVAAATQSTATAPVNAPKSRLLTSILLFVTFIGIRSLLCLQMHDHVTDGYFRRNDTRIRGVLRDPISRLLRALV